MRGILDDGDIGRHKRGHRRINKVNGKSRGLGRKTKKVDDNANTKFTAVDTIGHAETAFCDHFEIACHLLPCGPAFIPAFALKNGFHRQVSGARTRRCGHAHVVVINRLFQIGPFFWNRNLFSLHIACIPHDSIAGPGKTDVIAIGIVNGIRTDLLRDSFGRGRIFG